MRWSSLSLFPYWWDWSETRNFWLLEHKPSSSKGQSSIVWCPETGFRAFSNSFTLLTTASLIQMIQIVIQNCVYSWGSHFYWWGTPFMEGKSVTQTVHSNEEGQFGIKMFSLCENSFVYLGKEPNRNDDDPQLVPRLGKSGAVIPRLMKPR